VQAPQGAALAVIAAFLGAGQAELVAQQVEQGGPGLHLELTAFAVQLQADGAGLACS